MEEALQFAAGPSPYFKPPLGSSRRGFFFGCTKAEFQQAWATGYGGQGADGESRRAVPDTRRFMVV